MGANNNQITVVMTSDTELEGVVVTGYGTQKKVNLTCAVAAVSGEVLEDRPIVNVGEGLQGVIPNLNIDIRNGDPTTAPEFNIRGFESINGGNPLILVDGVPMDLGSLNPNDIASVSVLKDASSAAVYGARAAFGVILIETKKGRKGKITANFTSELSWGKPIMFLDPITDPYVYMTARNKANIRTNGTPSFDDEYVAQAKAYSENPTKENAWKVVDGSLRYTGYQDILGQYLRDWAPSKDTISVFQGPQKKPIIMCLWGISKRKDGSTMMKKTSCMTDTIFWPK